LPRCAGLEGFARWLPIHTYAWEELLRGMREHGLTEEEIAQMSKVNPARLLGLE
jgi:predicted metal-dependent phosphotriesterase family hydrolase